MGPRPNASDPGPAAVAEVPQVVALLSLRKSTRVLRDQVLGRHLAGEAPQWLAGPRAWITKSNRMALNARKHASLARAAHPVGSDARRPRRVDVAAVGVERA